MSPPSPQKKDKSQKCPEEAFQNRQHKTLRIERSTFTSSLFLKDFEPTLPISPECALILCGILSISSDFIPYSTLLNIHQISTATQICPLGVLLARIQSHSFSY